MASIPADAPTAFSGEIGGTSNGVDAADAELQHLFRSASAAYLHRSYCSSSSSSDLVIRPTDLYPPPNNDVVPPHCLPRAPPNQLEIELPITTSQHQSPAARHRPAGCESETVRSSRRRNRRSDAADPAASGRIFIGGLPKLIARLIWAMVSSSPVIGRSNHRRPIHENATAEIDRAQRLDAILAAVQQQLSVVGNANYSPMMGAQAAATADNYRSPSTASAIGNHADQDESTNSARSVEFKAHENMNIAADHFYKDASSPAAVRLTDPSVEDSVCGVITAADVVSANQNANYVDDLIIDEDRQAELEELFLSYLRLSSPDPTTALTFLHALNPHLISPLNHPS